MKTKRGYSVQILSQYGHGTHLAFSPRGLLPVVHYQRKWAVQYKRVLLAEGFTCRVVEVRYTEPVKANPRQKLRWSHPVKKP